MTMFMKPFLTTLCVFALSGCATYNLTANNLRPATPEDAKSVLLKSQQQANLWYDKLAVDHSYVQFRANVDFDQSDAGLYHTLGCSTSPIKLSGEQQSFLLSTLLNGQQENLTYPLFSFLKDTTAGATCGLKGNTVRIGPYMKARRQYILVADLKSSTKDKLQLSSLVTAIGAAGTAFATTTPGAATVLADVTNINAPALQNLENNLNANMFSDLNTSFDLLRISQSDIKQGHLVYFAPLYINKVELGSITPIYVGTLRIYVDTEISLFTHRYGATSDGFYLPIYVDEYKDPINVWHAPVVPPPVPPANGSNEMDLDAAVDNGVMASSDQISTMIANLKPDSTATEIDNVCNKIDSKLVQWGFTTEDILAAKAYALMENSAAYTGANFKRGKNGCFNRKQRDLMALMQVPSGNDDPLIGAANNIAIANTVNELMLNGGRKPPKMNSFALKRRNLLDAVKSYTDRARYRNYAHQQERPSKANVIPVRVDLREKYPR